MWWKTVLVAWGLAIGSFVAVQAVSAFPAEDNGWQTEKQQTNWENDRDIAVALARQGRYGAALDILTTLYGRLEARDAVAFDYAVIASWAGEYAKAIELYETKMGQGEQPVPAYVSDAVARAYFKLQRPAEAYRLYQRAAADGNEKARIWEAECLTALGRLNEAEHLYNLLLRDQPVDLAVYNGKARLLLLREDILGAAAMAEQALAQAEQAPGQYPPARLTELRGELAALLIRHEGYRQAILLLRPAVRDGAATLFMQCDYILALFLSGDYQTAVSTAQTLWPDTRQMPVYGRRALADAYLRLQLPRPAIDLYRSITKSQEGLLSDKHSLAYAYMLTTQSARGLNLYRELLPAGLEQASAAADDGDRLFALGHYRGGTLLYQVAIQAHPEQPFLGQRLAAVLLRSGLVRDAYRQYQILADSRTVMPPAVYSGLVDTAVAGGDYRAARQAIRTINRLYPEQSVTARALARFDGRPRGKMEALAVVSADDKGTKIRRWTLTGEQRLGDCFSVMAGRENRQFIDSDGTGSLQTVAVGARYGDMLHTAELWLEQGLDNSRPGGFRLLADRYFGEHSRLRLSVSHEPVETVAALAEQLAMTQYRLGFERQIGLQDFFSVYLTTAAYRDGNRSKGFDLDWSHIFRKRNNSTLFWFGYAGATGFSKQEINGAETAYDSPVARQWYGAGLRQRWDFFSHYWEVAGEIGWGRDRPEPLEFSPVVTVEYGRQLTKDQSLVLQASYGLRTGHATETGGGLRFGGRQIELRYNLSW